MANKKNAQIEQTNITNKSNIRKEEKITQEDLCARMQVLGYQINRSDISKIENCNKFIADFEVLGFAKALNKSILDLYNLKK